MKKKKFNAIKFAVGALAIACFLSVWFFATREGTTLGKLMPNPAEVASRLMEATYEKIGPKMCIRDSCWTMQCLRPGGELSDSDRCGGGRRRLSL